MIISFADKATEKVFFGEFSKAIPAHLAQIAQMKLLQIHHATKLEDLMTPPSNHLEKLKGDRKDQWSIRINKKYRICFYWIEADAHEVEIVDYH